MIIERGIFFVHCQQRPIFPGTRAVFFLVHVLPSVNHESKNRTTVGLQEYVLKMKALLDGYSRIMPCDAAGVKAEQEMKIVTFRGKKCV